MASKVYFTKNITPESVLELYKMLDIELQGNVALKVHSGEPGNQNFLRPEFWKDVVSYVGGTIVECNTAYEGARNTTERHIATRLIQNILCLKKHTGSDNCTDNHADCHW